MAQRCLTHTGIRVSSATHCTIKDGKIISTDYNANLIMTSGLKLHQSMKHTRPLNQTHFLLETIFKHREK
jgi:hypothetical protein